MQRFNKFLMELYKITYNTNTQQTVNSNFPVLESLTYYCICNHAPVFGHSKHCPDEANDTADNSKQHCSKDNKPLPISPPSQ